MDNIGQSSPASTGTGVTGSPVLAQDDPRRDTYLDYNWAKTRLKLLINDWDIVKDETERNRLLRFIKTDTESLKAAGLFKEDETYVGVRLIDQNIRAEQPQFISYLTQSRRSAIFKAKGDLQVEGIENLEQLFTDVCRYEGWELPWIKVVDGAMTHGWDFIEVVFDTYKPGHFSLEQVGHDQLMFDKETIDIQNQELIVRKEKKTAVQLRAAVKLYGFNAEVVEREIIEKTADNEKNTKDIVYEVFKCYFRFQDVIWVGYYTDKGSTWLKDPVRLFMGRRDTSKSPAIDSDTGVQDFPAIYETTFPYFILPYAESENPKIIQLVGRTFLDWPAQEASSAILSGIVNGTMRASNVYAAPDLPPGSPQIETGAPKQTDVKIKHGMIYDRPLKFFHTDYPDEAAIMSLQVITTANKAETSKTDFAVNNRRDSRKTATEISAAKEEASLLGSVQVTLLSIFVRSIYSYCYSIFRSRVLQQKIKINPELIQLFSVEFEVKSSGDVDVIQRQEKLARRQQAWPIISQTPLAMIFLQDIIKEAFPEDAVRYLAYLQDQQQGRHLIASLGTMLHTAITDEGGGYKPEYQQYKPELDQLQQQVAKYMGIQPQSDNGQPQGNGNGQQNRQATGRANQSRKLAAA